MRILVLLLLAATTTPAWCDWNAAVLAAIRKMPTGGGYAVTTEAGENFRSAVSLREGRLAVDARRATPSYCSSATYLLLLNVLAEAQRNGTVRLPAGATEALVPRQVPDGEGIWGRWNANGPGAARLFHELGAGTNFTSFDDARPGDFMKIFWRDAVGKNERGHLVVFLGRDTVDGVERVRFWSSNRPDGYGAKSVPRSDVAKVIFSRLERPERFAATGDLPKRDAYLAGLLTRESSFREACTLSGVK